MSILSENLAPTEAELLAAKARMIKSRPAIITRTLYNEWLISFNSLWANDKFTPAQKLEALGTDAKELFELNYSLTMFMLSQLAGKRDDLVAEINAKLASMPAFTIHDDGTVTLN